MLLSVEAGEDGGEPSAGQREAFAEFRKVEKRVFTRVERMLFDYYEADKAEIRADPVQGRRRWPDLKEPREVWRLAKATAIVVPVQRKKKGRVVMVDFRVKWDPEHGSRAMVRDGEVVKLMDPGAGW